MKSLKVKIKGKWGHFKKPDTNNNPLTHSFITKTALLGLMGAVNGVEREEMRELFPQLSEDIIYNVQVGSVKKEAHGFTYRNLKNEAAPKSAEYLKDVECFVVIGLKNERSQEFFDGFSEFVKKDQFVFQPTLGKRKCTAILEHIQEMNLEEAHGVYSTKGFVLRSHKFAKIDDISKIRFGFDKVPTFQDNHWFNPPESYVEVVYPMDNTCITVMGEHYASLETQEKFCLI